MLINEILEFNKKKYFSGAVQANWFYDNEKVGDIASSYVFHGPKYHGVGQDETSSTKYKLNDTATYALKLLRKAKETESNRFNMTIAGYGTGKSHLSVALGSLLSGHDAKLRQIVVDNMQSIDRDISREMSEYTGKNLVLVLNGMRDFNLNSEILSVAKKAVVQHGLSDDIFYELTKQYQQAANFCRNTFETCRESYNTHLESAGCSGISNPEDVVAALENADARVFNAVNEVYREFMGTYINVDSDISASDVLALLVKKYCMENHMFDRVYILFDEFGRYIEFTANNPHIAGDSALQQIFEVIQNSEGYIVFDAFIQSDLNSYIRRVENSNSNITRYVGRYENSDKYYLSSNFETILANLIEKKDSAKFRDLIEYNIDEACENYHKKVFTSLCSWAKPEIANRNVWINDRMYFDVIAKGCYPIHPITVWFLANTSSWMQQRSTIAYTSEMFDDIADSEVSGKWLPYVYPTDIIGTGLFNEMQSTEEKGYVSSQNCMAYQSIISKLNGKLSDTAVTVLRAILIINILKFRLHDKASCMICICTCSGLNEDDVKEAITVLENEHCVITFDENLNRYTLNAEAHGKQEYTIALMKKQAMLRSYDPIMDMDEELLNELKINQPENTSFAIERQISSSEWQFEKRFISSSEVSEAFCNSIILRLNNAVDGELCRGIIVYVYCGKTADRDIAVLTKLIRAQKFDKLPVFFYLLIDKEENWLFYLRRRAAIRKFTESEKEMYSRFITQDRKALMRKITSDFNRMKTEKNTITASGVEKFSEQLGQICYDKFNEIYHSVIPFSITEFEKKITPSAKKILLALCRNMYSGIMCNKQSYQGLDPTEKRRIKTALSTTDTETSWQVFDSGYSLREPKNSRVKKMYNSVLAKISPDNQHTIASLFSEYRYPPYGLNNYSLFLFISYVLAFNSKRINIFENTMLLSKDEFINKYLSSEKKMLENIFKLRITLRTQTDDELIEEFLSEVESVQYFERCSELLKKQNELDKNFDFTDEVKKRFSACSRKLKEGMKISNEFYTPLGKAEKILELCRKQFSLINIADVLKGVNIIEVDTPVSEYSEFLFSSVYCKRVNAVLKEALEMLDNNFSSFVANLKCAYSESSEFKKQYTKVAKILSEKGRKDYAATLKNKISSALVEAELEQKYASVLSDAQRFIAQVNSEIRTLDYNSYREIISAIQGWINTFDCADDMSSVTKSDYLTKLSELKNCVENQKSVLDKEISMVLSEIKNPTVDITRLSEYINNAIRLSPDDDIFMKLKQSGQLLEEFRIMKLESASKDIHEIELDYNERWKGTVCEGYALELINSLKEKISLKRTEWMRRNVTEIHENLSYMSMAQCIKWQSLISELPDYLEDSDLDNVMKLSDLITEKIKSQKIQGVVEMFNALSEHEREECLSILMNKKRQIL